MLEAPVIHPWFTSRRKERMCSHRSLYISLYIRSSSPHLQSERTHARTHAQEAEVEDHQFEAGLGYSESLAVHHVHSSIVHKS